MSCLTSLHPETVGGAVALKDERRKKRYREEKNKMTEKQGAVCAWLKEGQDEYASSFRASPMQVSTSPFQSRRSHRNLQLQMLATSGSHK